MFEKESFDKILHKKFRQCVYSANMANSRSRGRVFMGHDASMELGGSLKITADQNSTSYKK